VNVSIVASAVGGMAAIGVTAVGARARLGAVLGSTGLVVVVESGWHGGVYPWPYPSGLGLSVGSWVGTARGEGERLEGRLCGPDHSKVLLLRISVPSSKSRLGLGLQLGNAMVLAVASGVCWLFAINLPLRPCGLSTCLPDTMVLLLCVLMCHYMPVLLLSGAAAWLKCHCYHHMEGCAGPSCYHTCSQAGRKQAEPADVIWLDPCYVLLSHHVMPPAASDMPDPQSLLHRAQDTVTLWGILNPRNTSPGHAAI
jgi:hypothetical protein